MIKWKNLGNKELNGPQEMKKEEGRNKWMEWNGWMKEWNGQRRNGIAARQAVETSQEVQMSAREMN